MSQCVDSTSFSMTVRNAELMGLPALYRLSSADSQTRHFIPQSSLIQFHLSFAMSSFSARWSNASDDGDESDSLPASPSRSSGPRKPTRALSSLAAAARSAEAAVSSHAASAGHIEEDEQPRQPAAAADASQSPALPAVSIRIADLRARAAAIEAQLDIVRDQIQAHCPTLFAIRCYHGLYVAPSSLNGENLIVATPDHFIFSAHWLDDQRLCLEVPGIDARSLHSDESITHALSQIRISASRGGGGDQAGRDGDAGRAVSQARESDGPGSNVGSEPQGLQRQSSSSSSSRPQLSLSAPFGHRVFLNIRSSIKDNFLGLGGRPKHIGLSAVPHFFSVERHSPDERFLESAPPVVDAPSAAASSLQPGAHARVWNVSLRSDTGAYWGANKRYYGADIDCAAAAFGPWERFQLIPVTSYSRPVSAAVRPLPDSDENLRQALQSFATICRSQNP